MFDWTHVFQASSDYTGMRPNMWWYKRYSWPHLFARCLMLFSTVGYVFLPSAAVWANPVGEEVVGGSASFDRQGNTLTINQATERLAVNWQDFSIAAGETTHFNMPSAASIALNRVLGGNPSQIYGTLSSNGNIILVNNAGIFVGPGGVINAASFVGSTLDIDPQQFMNAGQGGYQLHGNSYAPIVNQGNITAEKGDVFLIAQKVENRGTLSAANGKASMVGAGERTEVVLHEVGGAGFAVRVTQLEGEHASGSNHNLPDGEELLNEGEIAAAQAELNASGNIYALAIKNTGTIRAKAVVAQADGTVRLDGGAGDVLNAGSLIAKNAGDISTAAGGKIEVTGQNVTASPESIITAAGGEQGGNGGKVKIDSADTTIVQGKVDVAAPAAGAKGGKVELLGEKVGLFEGAKVDASGGAGGGTVLAGGDYLGGQTPRPEIKELAKQEAEPVKNAKATVMADTAEIRADATVSGDGGKVILWSDEYTGFYGQLFARGGLEGGDGGFIETSSLGNLQAFGSAAALATGGQAGLWLLDPFDVTVVAASPSVATFANPFTSTVASTSILNTQVGAALAGGATVRIITGSGGAEAGRINVNAPITGANGTLVLSAINDIFINDDVTLTVGGVEFFTSGGNININAPVTGTTSAIFRTSGGGININDTVTANSIQASSTQAMIINENISATAGAGSGTIELVSGGGVSGTGLITSNTTGGLSILANGVVNIGTTGGPVGVDTGNFWDITLFTTTGKITVGSVNGINGLSGGDISLTAPIIELGSAPVTATNGEFNAKATTRVEFIAATDRFDPAVVTDLAQSYDGLVTLSADTFLRTSRDISFKNNISGSNDFIIENNGNGALNLFGSVGFGTSLASFRVEGGTVNLHSGVISTSGSTTFDGANLVLWSNTTLNSGKDLIILGTVNSSSADTPVTLAGTIGGNVILDGLVGGAAALGKVDLTATGQIAVNGGITTLPGDDPINTGADGSIKLTAGKAVVLAGPIDTRGGLSAPTGVGGNLTVKSGGDVNENIQIQSTINTRGGFMKFEKSVFFTGVSTLDTTAGNNSGTISFDLGTDSSAVVTIRGGTGQVVFSGPVGSSSPLLLDVVSAGGVNFGSSAVFGATANITSYSGPVGFGGTVNKVNAGDLILDLGNQNLTFSGGVGDSNPFGLTVNSAKDVTFSIPVQMGGDFVFNNLSGNFLTEVGTTINSAANVNGIPHDLIINPVNRVATVTLRAVGTTSPLRAVTVGSGGANTTLNGNIFTAGGAVALGSPVSLATGAITIDTTRLGNSAGANISFQQTLGGSQALTLLGGTAGIIGFGGNVTALTGLTVASGASISVTDGSSVNIPGNIDITPVVRTPGTGLSLTTTGTGTIRLRNGVFLSANQNAAARGGNLTINGAGAVTIDGTIESRGGFSGGGYAGGTIDITGDGITIGTVDLTGGNGPASNTFGQGGNGGRLVLTSSGGAISAGNITLNGGDADSRNTATGGDPGGDAGSISISGGTFTMRGSISANGGTGDNLGVGGRGGVLSLPAILLGAASTSITARGGANGTGQNGTGLDGSLTFTGTVNGTTADQNNLQLDVGSGNIKFEQAVGTTRLGNLRVLNAQNLAFDSTLSALTMVQLGSLPASGNAIPANSAGTTTFTGLVTLAGSGTVLDLRGYNFAFGAGLDTSGGKGSVNGEFNGVLTVGGTGLTLGGDMTLAGGGLAGTNPRVDLNFAGTAISTSSGALTFGTLARPLNVRLLANTTLSTGASGGQISFGGLLDSDATPRNLTLNSGGAVTLNGLVGSLSPLGSLTTDAGGSLVLAAVGSRANPSINATGLLTFNDQVDLRAATVLKANAVNLSSTGLIDGANDLLVLLPVSAGAGTLLTLSGQVGQATPLTGLRVEGGVGTTLGFAGTQANPSVNTTGNQYYGSAVTLGAATVLNAGSLDFLSTINGANSLLLNSPGAINLYGKVGDTGGGLTQFQTTGGGALNLLATGATSGSPSIRTTGAQLFGSSLVLGEDTVLRSTGTGDFIFLNTIDSRLANQPRAFEVIGNAKMVLEAAAGATTRLKSATLTGTGDVTVLAGINTFGGAINLESTSGAVVLGGNTDSGVADQLGGAVNLKSATQVLLNGGVITTFGGAVAFNDGALGTSFIQTASTIITAGGTSGGSITFNNDLNGSAGLTLTAGRGALNFDAIGTTNPLGLTVNSSGAVTLNEAVRLGGDFVFNDLSGNFNAAALATIDSAVDAFGNPHGLFINPVNSTATVNLQAIGATSPLGAVVVGSGGGTTTLNGNILTAGGGVSIGSPLILPNGLVVDTTRLGRTGGGVTFLGRVDTDAGGANLKDISITAGTGAVTFAGAVGATRKPRDLTVNSGGSISFTDVANLNVARDILVIPQASSVNDMTLTAGRNIEFRQGITARPNNGPGRNLTATADNGTLTIGGSINVAGRSGTFIGFAPDGSTFTFATAGAKGGTVTLKAQSITTGVINANGSDNFVTGGNGGDGGSVVLTSKNDLITGPINVSGGTDGDLGGVGGTINLVRSEASGNVRVGTLSSVGGASNKGVGAAGGSITVSATLGDLVAPTDFLTQGGSGSGGFVAGQGGTVTLRATAGSLSFANSTLNLAGDGGLTITAGKHLILATVADVTTPSLSTGGVVFTLNTGAPRLDRRGGVTLEYGSANNGGTFFMPASSYVVSNGGDIRVDVRDIAGGQDAGAMTISGFSTSGDNVNGGRILLNSNPGAGGLGAVTVLGALETLGGTPTTPTYGRAGGSIFIAGTTVSVGSINTAGSSSLATATTPAFGGSGGDIEIRGDTGITLRRNLVTTGGTGQGVGDANGGGGGGISLKGDVTLNSGDSQNTIIILNTQGGGLAAQGSYGLGGSITATGKITGTTSTSNTLDLRYGSGTATLGDAAADTITLGTLITAADDPRSTGSLVINGKLVVDNMITYARGYSLSIFGAGTQFSSLYTFLNTGTVGLGAAGAGVTFVGGFNSTAGAATRLNGIVNTGSLQSLDNGGNMAMGAVILAADSTLNSNGNNITLTTIDNDPGVSGAKDLTFASGIGSTGTVTISGAVGSLNPVDVVTVNSAGPVTFASSFNGGAIVTAAGTTTTFRGGTSVTGPLNGITTTGASSLGGTVSLVNSLYASDTTQVFTLTSSGAFSMPGTVTMSGGPFALAGNGGSFAVGGTLSGSQPLTLSGTTTKTFSGTLSIGNGTTAITATGGAVTFGGIATLSGASTFAMAPTLAGGTITASGLTTMDAGLSLGGAGTLGGAGPYQINGNISGAGQRLTLSGAGQKTITGTTTVGGITQNSGSGQASFGSSVTTSSTSDFFGAVVLRGTTFTAGGATTYNTLSLQAGDVILAGNFAYTVSGAVTGNADGTRRNLTLNGNQAKTFNGALSGIETLAIGGGSLDSSGGLEANTLTQNGNAMTLGGSVNVANALTLDGATSLNSGTILTAASGLNISAGSFASNGSARLAGGTVTIGIGTLTSNAGTLTVAPDILMAASINFEGPGNYAFLGNLSRSGGFRSVTLNGGSTSFAGTLTGVNNLTGYGAVSFGNNVTTIGFVEMNGVTSTSANVTINSNFNQTFRGAVTLGGNLTSQTTSTASFGGGVSGVGNLTVNGAGSVDIGAGIENRGTFLLTRAGAINLGLGDLTASEVGLIRSSEGATFEATGGSSAAASGITANTGMTLRSTLGSASASSVVANTGLTLDGATGATIAGTTVNGDLNMTTLSVANFNASLSSARSLGIQAASISSGGQAGVLANISVPVLGGITLTGGGLDYQPAGNLTTTGRIATSGDVVLAPSGNFVNSFRGNPFTAPSVKILTQDFFSYPASAGVPGLANVFGVSSVAQLGANQIGVAKGLLAGSAGPYITEFTTGTGQPYILATQNNAVPPVMLPMALPSAGTAFASRVTFTQDELEMMTPEERSAFEAGRRQQAARVMLQREGGLSEEIGTPAEGQIPQAKAPEPAQPAPTAQVLLDGKPLASTSEKDRGDASRLLRTRPMRAVVLRGDSESQRLMESERIAAEVTLGSIPVAGNR